jgi:hypothetical protein
VEAVTTREVEWDDEQQAMMLALAEYRDSVHEACGGYLPDTTAAEADGQYVADIPSRCHLCTARAIAAEPYFKDDHPQPHALLFPVRRK